MAIKQVRSNVNRKLRGLKKNSRSTLEQMLMLTAKSYANTQRQEALGTVSWLDDQGVKRTFRNEKPWQRSSVNSFLFFFADEDALAEQFTFSLNWKHQKGNQKLFIVSYLYFSTLDFSLIQAFDHHLPIFMTGIDYMNNNNVQLGMLGRFGRS